MNARRVAVTGIGVVSPLGSDLAAFRARLIAGESAAAPVSLFDASGFATRIAAQVRAEDFTAVPATARDRKIGFGLTAARNAVADAQAHGAPLARTLPRGAAMGIGLELFSMPDMLRYLAVPEVPAGEHPLGFLQTPSDLCLHLVSREHGLTLPPLLHVSACAASTDAIGMAFRMVRDGEAAWMLAGGTDSMINPMGLGGFCKIQAMTTRNHEPARASRPFDRERDGFLLGEGAGMLVLEEWEAARARGARIHAELLGYGASFDAFGISDPHPEGEGARLAMQRALADAGIEPGEVAHINAHGTSTRKNDTVETLAIHRLFGAHARRLTVNATKSMIGHLISASGAVELAAQILCGVAPDGAPGVAHPTINLDNPDPECDLDYVAQAARPLAGPVFLKNSFGFGGQNASLAVRLNWSSP